MAQLESETAAWRDKARNFEQKRCYEEERPEFDKKGKTRKKQATVTVDPAWLINELKELNSKRRPPQKKLELNHDLSDKNALSKLATQLAEESPAGGPNKASWEKLLTGQPLRSDVAKQHLARFFEEHEHLLKNPFQYLET
jgi:hypothetical protein